MAANEMLSDYFGSVFFEILSIIDFEDKTYALLLPLSEDENGEEAEVIVINETIQPKRVEGQIIYINHDDFCVCWTRFNNESIQRSCKRRIQILLLRRCNVNLIRQV